MKKEPLFGVEPYPIEVESSVQEDPWYMEALILPFFLVVIIPLSLTYAVLYYIFLKIKGGM